MSDAAVQLRGVHLAFGDREILSGVQLGIPAAGATFVVGRSGAGKSVLCRLAVGLLRPTAGEVHLFGQPLTGRSERQLLPLRRQAPYLVQGPALLDWLTLRQNVALADRSSGPDDVLQALGRVGLQDVADRLPPEVGPGIRKRAAIARALLLRPRYLLFDEPTTGLHEPAARQVSEVLVRLREEGLGALVVSHDYLLLARLADRVVLVEAGQARLYEGRQAFLESSDPEVRELLRPVEAELSGHG
jgi:phospholipid/cholesterol/gamma-HCH transport system ATP-binding protein